MPRTAATQVLAARGSSLAVAPTAIDVANGHKIDAGTDGKVVFVVNNTTASTKTVTVKSGSFSQGGQGDLVVSMNASTSVVIGPLESARFKQADGCYYLDYAAAMTGTVIPIHLP